MNGLEANISNIMAGAVKRGACAAAEGVTTFREAVELLLSPQGREFAMRTGYPWISTWRENADEADRCAGVYLDCGSCRAVNADCVAVGRTEMALTLHGAERLYRVVAMHGARVRLNAGGYAVATVTEAGGTVEVVNDGTAIITIERP